MEWHLGSEHIDCDIDSGFQFKLVLAGSEQDGLLVVVTIVVMNSPHVGCTMGHVKLQALSSSECWTLICEVIIPSLLQVSPTQCRCHNQGTLRPINVLSFTLVTRHDEIIKMHMFHIKTTLLHFIIWGRPSPWPLSTAANMTDGEWMCKQWRLKMLKIHMAAERKDSRGFTSTTGFAFLLRKVDGMEEWMTWSSGLALLLILVWMRSRITVVWFQVSLVMKHGFGRWKWRMQSSQPLLYTFLAWVSSPCLLPASGDLVTSKVLAVGTSRKKSQRVSSQQCRCQSWNKGGYERLCH